MALHIPPLPVPVPSRVHPLADDAEAHLLNRLDAVGLLASPRHRAQVASTRLGTMAARMCPDAQPEPFLLRAGQIAERLVRGRHALGRSCRARGEEQVRQLAGVYRDGWCRRRAFLRGEGFVDKDSGGRIAG